MLQGMIAAGTGYGAAMTEAAVRADFSVAPDYVGGAGRTGRVIARPARTCCAGCSLIRN